MKGAGSKAEPLYTLPELVEQVRTVLGPTYPRAAWDREIPSETTIRYYRRLGLVDRPAQKRGRVALYGYRHLCQIIATKRMQATGLLLNQIRRQLGAMKTGDFDVIFSDPPFSSPPDRPQETHLPYRVSRRGVFDSTAGSGALLATALDLGKYGARRGPPTSGRRSSGVPADSPRRWITSHTGSGKSHMFAMSLLHEIEKRDRLAQKVPVQISIAPEIQITVMAHLSKALTTALLQLLREQFQAALFGVPARPKVSDARSSRRRRQGSPRATS